MDYLPTLGDTLMGFENAIDGAAGGDGEVKQLQGGVPQEGVADCLLTGHTTQALQGLIPDGEHLPSDQRVNLDRWVLARTGVALQDLLQRHACSSFFPQACAPFFHPCF